MLLALGVAVQLACWWLLGILAGRDQGWMLAFGLLPTLANMPLLLVVAHAASAAGAWGVAGVASIGLCTFAQVCGSSMAMRGFGEFEAYRAIPLGIGTFLVVGIAWTVLTTTLLRAHARRRRVPVMR